MNAQPNYNYLRTKALPVQDKAPVLAQQPAVKQGVFRVRRNNSQAGAKFDDAAFRRIVSLAKSKRTDKTEQVSKMLNHQSLKRVVPVERYNKKSAAVQIMKILEEFELRLKN